MAENHLKEMSALKAFAVLSTCQDILRNCTLDIKNLIMRIPRYFNAVALAIVLLGVVTAQNSTTSLPVLDLGYALHRAAAFNVTLPLPICSH